MSIGVTSRKRRGSPAAPWRVLVPGVLLMLAFSGCLGRDMAGGTDVLADPVGRRLNWFAYLDGADIKRTCRPDGDDRARMVLNGRYTDQVRTYDLRDGGGGGTATLETHVFAGLQVNAGFTPGSLGDVLSGRPQELRLGRAETDALWAALRASGAFEGAPKGLRLDSEEVYWIAVGCRDGAVFFNAWRHPSLGFDRLVFPEVLKRAERSDVPWPRLDEPVDVFRQKDIREGERPHFEVEVAGQGIVR